MLKIVKKQSQQPVKQIRRNLWFEKIMAILVTVNLLLVLFDLSYIPWRDFWLGGKIQLFVKIGTIELEFPQHPVKILPFNITPVYDLVKGIEEQRDTTQYLDQVENLNQQINQIALQAPETNGSSTREKAEVIDAILTDLRNRSKEIINTNPFQIANKTGTLEKIKNRMRQHIFGNKEDSSKEAFDIFWSRKHLTQKGFREELNFFDREIKPLLETNYFRPIGENGELVDNFGLLDFPFFIIFGLEFLARTWYISRRRTGVSWLDAMLWRWYDIFLLIPVFRWLRAIPATIRLDRSGLIDLTQVRKQASQGLVAGIAEDLTEVVIIRIINQTQDLIRQGKIVNFLSQRQAREYIDLNNTNEIVEISKTVIEVFFKRVIPEIEKDLEAILQHSIAKIFDRSLLYRGIRQLPGGETLKNNLSEELAKQIYRVVVDNLNALLEKDPLFDELVASLVANLNKSIDSEIQAQQSIQKIESLIADLLEEIKINYVERLSQEDVEEILEQTRALKQIAKKPPQLN